MTLRENWNPNMTYTRSMKEIKAWFEYFGRSGFYNGRLYTLKYKKLCPGLYDIRFEEA